MPKQPAGAGSSSAGTDDLPGWRMGGNPISDTYAAEDKLGFQPYIDAITAFLTDKSTAPPLTMSIEGEWGSGKSSFMHQIEGALDPEKRAGGQRGKEPKRPAGLIADLFEREPRNMTFWFNAWRYDRQDAVWAAFALFIAKEIRVRRRVLPRLWGDLKLAAYRLTTPGAKLGALFVALVWVLLLGGSIAATVYTMRLPKEDRAKLVGTVTASLGEAVGPPAAAEATPRSEPKIWRFVVEQAVARGWVATLLVLGMGWYWVEKHVGKHLEFSLEKYLSTPDYKSRTTFVESFHEDFERLIRAYRGRHRMFVFVDDLDRCDVPRAADLMQAINLMIGDNPIIFILGMDREKVAAGITLKNRDLLEYLRPVAVDDSGLSARHPSAFGYSFLEKFIQITFRVPRPDRKGIHQFLDSLSGSVEGEAEQEAKKRSDQSVREERRKRVEVVAGPDSDEVRELVKLVAPVLDWNPRRMKQFINSFRLHAYIVSDLGLLDTVQGSNGLDEAKLTLEQLGKFVAILMTWPDLVMDLMVYPWILRSITQMERDPSASLGLAKRERLMMERWAGEMGLPGLLLAGVAGKDGWRYSMESADLSVLLNISPRVHREASAPGGPSGAVGGDGRGGAQAAPPRSPLSAEKVSETSGASFEDSPASEAPPIM